MRPSGQAIVDLTNSEFRNGNGGMQKVRKFQGILATTTCMRQKFMQL